MVGYNAVMRLGFLLALLGLVGGTRYRHFLHSRRSLYPTRRGCNNTDSYYFNVQPKGITIREGGRAFLECNVSNRCNIKFQWSLDEQIIQNTTRRYQNGSNLIITRVNRTLDSGIFHCLATLTTTGISKESRIASLSILWMEPNATAKLVDGDAEEIRAGKAPSLTLQCDVQGSEDMEFRWFWNGRRLKRSNSKEKGDESLPYFTVDGDLLVVREPRARDNGLYACAAENTAGLTRNSLGYLLSVEDERIPELKTQPRDTLTKLGGRVELNCAWDGASKTSWTRPGQTHLPNGRAKDGGDGKLVIEGVEKEDGGWYTCLGFPANQSTKLPPQAVAAKVSIASLGEFETATSFEPIAALYAVGMGKRFKVACIPPTGFPQPHTFWSRDNKRLTNEGRVRAEGLQLVIDSAHLDDAGEYQCFVENLAGQRKASVNLHVSRPATLERHPSGLDVGEGHNASFICQYKGSPYPVSVVEWEQDGARLEVSTEEDRKRVSYTPDGRLSISNLRLDDQGPSSLSVVEWEQDVARLEVSTEEDRKRVSYTPDGRLSISNLRLDDQGPPSLSVVEWEQDGARLEVSTEEDRKRVSYTPDGRLSISNLRLDDQGPSSLSVVEWEQDVARLEVSTEEDRKRVSYTPDGRLSISNLRLDDQGPPSLSVVEWEQDGARLEVSTEEDRKRVSYTPDGRLSISNLRLDDQGPSSLSVVEWEQDGARLEVSTEEDRKRVSYTPDGRLSISNLRLDDQGPSSLSVVEWEQDGARLEVSTEEDRKRVSYTPDGRLSISNLRLDDQGPSSLSVVEWEQDGARLEVSTEEDRKRVSYTPDGRLSISNLRLDDQGPSSLSVVEWEQDGARLEVSTEEDRKRVSYTPDGRLSISNLRLDDQGPSSLSVVEWEQDGARLEVSTEEDRKRVSYTPDGRLSISNLRLDDQGPSSLSVVEWEQDGARLEMSTEEDRKRVSYTPDGRLSISNLRLDDQGPSSLSVVEWEQDGARLEVSTEEDRKRVSYTPDGRLSISNLRLDDQGPSSLSVVEWEQDGARLEMSTEEDRKRVSYTPDGRLSISNLRLDDQGPSSLSVVEWEQDGARLEVSTEEDRKRVSYTPDGRLSISNLRLDDQGSYVCVVKTADQEDVRSKPAQLRVRENLKWDPRPPLNQRLKENQNAQIQCKAKGDKSPVVKWLKEASIGLDGKVTKTYSPATNDFPPNIRDKNGTLYIHGVKFEDAGKYICVAASPQGVINKTITVEVSVPPEFYLVPANRTVWEGADVRLDCGARGTPAPTLDWFFERQEMREWDFSNYQKFANNSLVIRGVKARSNAGSYSCIAGNKGGLERRVALLCVRMRPSNVTHCGTKHGMRSANDHFMEVEESSEGGLKSTTIAIAVGAAGGYILLVICLVGWCAYRRRRGLEKLQLAHDASAGPLVQPVEGVHNQAHHHSMTERQLSTPGPYRHSPRSGVSSSKQSSLDRMGFPRENIDLVHLAPLGSGVFGDVYVAPVAVGDGITNALVKVLLVKDVTLHQQLRDEMDLFTKTEHPNVARLIGLCRDREPIYVIYQYAPLNLKHYLVYSRPGRADLGAQKPALLSLPQIISVSYQVAQGMEHITDLRFVHKDLAARNIILDENLVAKVTSLSLQNSPFLSEYYVYHNLTCPLRWMPAEALFDDEWSMKSDVWSFGIFLWELLSMGELPYVQASNDEVIEGLKDDSLRLGVPGVVPGVGAEIALPDSLARLLRRCWKTSPRDRPTFTEIRDVIGALHVETNC